MSRKKGQKKARRLGFELTSRQLLKIALYFFAGAAYVVWIYTVVENGADYRTPYEFHHTVQKYLYPVWALGLLIMLYIYAVSKKINYLSVTVLTVFAGWYCFDEPLHKHLVVVNFSDRNRSVQVDGINYLIEPDEKLEFLFARRNVVVDGELLEKKGCYLVNASYPQKYLRFAPDRNFHYKDITFDKVGPWALLGNKITRIDPNPRSVVEQVCGRAWKNSISYCIWGIDSQKVEP